MEIKEPNPGGRDRDSNGGRKARMALSYVLPSVYFIDGFGDFGIKEDDQRIGSRIQRVGSSS
jgi:hypothetical protein